MKLLTVTTFFSVFILIVNLPVQAEDAYRWQDEKGHVIFGSKPPQNAQHVEKLALRTLSRYSAAKVLQHLGQAPAKSKETSIIEKDLRQSLAHGEPFHSFKLEHDKIALTVDEKNRITSCAVSVNNAGSITAHGVTVSFEFPGGAIIPATGPEQIEPHSKEMYAVATELLPISRVKPGNKSKQDSEPQNAKHEDLTPRVIIRYNEL